MKKLIFFIFCLMLLANEGFSQCQNANFSSLDFTNWTGSTGMTSAGNYTNVVPGIVPNRHTIISAPGTDPNTNNLLSLLPPGGTSCARLGNDDVNYEAERLSYTLLVDPTNSIFTYQYAVVLEDPSHPVADQPKFTIYVKDAGGTIVDPVCGIYEVTAAGSIPGFNNYGDIRWKDWTTVGIDLSAFIGQNVTIEFTTYDCGQGAHFGYAYLSCYCGALQLAQQCMGTSNEVSAPAGFASYLWSPGGETTQTITCTFPPYANGDTVTCTATSVQGCSIVLQSILANDAPSFTIDSADVCQGQPATLTVTGITTGDTYSWSTGDVGDSITVTPPITTIYTVTATSPGGCSETVSTSVTVYTTPAVNTTQTNVACYNGATGQASVVPSTGLTYVWSTNPPQYTGTISNLTAGTYSVTVSDVGGCDTVLTFNITQPAAALQSAIVSNISPLCNGGSNGSLEVQASGGTTTYSYLWNTSPAQNTPIASGLSAGTYGVTVTDANGCTSAQSATVTQPPPMNIFSTPTLPLCFGQSNGSILATPTGGTAPYTYLWNTSPTQTGATAVGLGAGTYTVIVTDSNNCTDTATFNLAQPPVMVTTLDNNLDSLLCFGDDNGYATINVVGGSAPWSFEWNTTPPQYNMTANNLPAGTYTLTVTDNNGCTATHTVNVTQPPQLFVQADSLNEECLGGCDGQATSAVTGGTLPYTYEWFDSDGSMGLSTLTIVDICAGPYYLIITDANGCMEFDSTEVGTNNLLSASFTATPLTGNVPLDVTFTYTGTSSPTNSYYWNFGDGYISGLENPTHTYTEADTFNVMLIVTDGICEDTAYLLITPELPSLLIVPNVFTPNGDGINDQFHFQYESIATFHCIIFNRWGRLIYEWFDISHGWDGTMNNGSIASDGVYYYILEATGYDDVTYEMHGTITLIQ